MTGTPRPPPRPPVILHRMPIAPKCKAAPRAASKISHQYTCPFVQMTPHDTDSSNLGNTNTLYGKVDKTFKPGGRAYESLQGTLRKPLVWSKGPRLGRGDSGSAHNTFAYLNRQAGTRPLRFCGRPRYPEHHSYRRHLTYPHDLSYHWIGRVLASKGYPRLLVGRAFAATRILSSPISA
jgi:hypothetical protein